MHLLERFKWWGDKKRLPITARHGQMGERAAKKHLQKRGLKYLTSNFSAGRGEIDLVFREDDCLVFVEVKTRGVGGWTRPAAAVNARKRRLLTQCAFDYLRLLKTPPIKIRFDVVEVLLQGDAVAEIRHLPNTFTLSAPYRYG